MTACASSQSYLLKGHLWMCWGKVNLAGIMHDEHYILKAQIFHGLSAINSGFFPERSLSGE